MGRGRAVTVVTGATLASIGPVINTSDLINAVPGARFTNLGDPLLSEISIRGSGTERATGADSSVGIYFNGAYLGGLGAGRSFQPVDSFDMDHLEVLEGPQGALYGRDAEYGIVNLISQRPTFSNSGYVDELYDFSIRQNQATGVVNYRVNDNWAVRLSGKVFDADGAADATRVHSRSPQDHLQLLCGACRATGQHDDDAIRRVPTQALDDLVARRLAALVGDGAEPPDADDLRRLVIRVEVNASRVHIILRRQILLDLTGRRVGLDWLRTRLNGSDRVVVDAATPDRIRIEAPVRLKLRGGRTYSVGPGGEGRAVEARADTAAIRRLRLG